MHSEIRIAFMNLKQYFTQAYLFNIDTAFISPKEKLFLFAGAILVLLAVVFKIASVLALNPVDKRVRQRFYVLFLTIGLSELVWYLCRIQNARFFGSHFVAWFIVLIGLVWFVTILVSVIRSYRKDKGSWNKEQMKMKYLAK